MLFIFSLLLIIVLPVLHQRDVRAGKDRNGAVIVICWLIGITLAFFALGYSPF
jgi:hypothetical protein